MGTVKGGNFMKTTIYGAADLLNEAPFDHIRRVILEGGLVVFPTETVYGIGANALNPGATKKIYDVKGRPSDNPLIVHVASKEDVKRHVLDVSEEAKQLMDAFWPGPLTLIFHKNNTIPTQITGGLETVAIRCPNHPIAQKILEKTGLPICAPSANISGKPSSTLFEHVVGDFDGKVDVILDGGKSTIGLESTVLDLTTPKPMLLRPGAITKRMIEATIGKTVLDGSAAFIEGVPKSPGMKYTHYAPKGRITVIFGEKKAVVKYINDCVKDHVEKKEKVVVLCAAEYESNLSGTEKIVLGSWNDEAEIASNLFIALRKTDELGVGFIYIHAFPMDSIGFATMNRLLKASGYNVVSV